MIPTVELLAMTNTELNASLVKIKQLRQQQEEDRRRIAELKAQIAGQAQPHLFGRPFLRPVKTHAMVLLVVELG